MRTLINFRRRKQRCRFLLTINLEYLGFTDDGFQFKPLIETFTAALGQAFISLSLGFGLLLVYGSYFSPKENLFLAVSSIEFFDTLAALLSVAIIIPVIFAAGLSSTSGPGLTFISLPHIFQHLSGGYFWAFAFYLLLILATVTSTISIFEMLTNLLTGYKAMKPIIHNIRRSAHVSTTFTRYFLITLRYIAPIGLIILLLCAVTN